MASQKLSKNPASDGSVVGRIARGCMRLAVVKLESYNQLDPGFLRLTADAGGLEIEYFVVPFDGGPVVRFDSVRA